MDLTYSENGITNLPKRICRGMRLIHVVKGGEKRKSTSRDDKTMESVVALFPKCSDNDTNDTKDETCRALVHVDIMLSDGNFTYQSRILPSEIKEWKKKSIKDVINAGHDDPDDCTRKLNDICRYLLNDVDNIMVTYELAVASGCRREIKVVVKEKKGSIAQTLWIGYLRWIDSTHSTEKNKKSAHGDEERLQGSALPFIKILYDFFQDLDQDLMATKLQRDQYKKSMDDLRENYQRLESAFQERQDELLENFLLLHNDTKERYREVVKQLEDEKKKNQETMKRLSTKHSSYSKDMKSRAPIELPQDHVDEHDYKDFSADEVQRYASGMPVPTKSFTSTITLQNNESNGMPLMSQLSCSQDEQNSQILSQVEFESQTTKNPHTGAIEMWNPAAIFQDYSKLYTNEQKKKPVAPKKRAVSHDDGYNRIQPLKKQKSLSINERETSGGSVLGLDDKQTVPKNKQTNKEEHQIKIENKRSNDEDNGSIASEKSEDLLPF